MLHRRTRRLAHRRSPSIDPPARLRPGRRIGRAAVPDQCPAPFSPNSGHDFSWRREHPMTSLRKTGSRCINRRLHRSVTVEVPAARLRSGRGYGMPDDPTVTLLVRRARQGDSKAWDELVERYAPLVWSICRRHRLSRTDSEDVGQSVWLRLVEHLSELREPAALP